MSHSDDGGESAAKQARTTRGRGSFGNTMTSSEGAVTFESLREDDFAGAGYTKAPTATAAAAAGPRAVLYVPKGISPSTVEGKVNDLGAQVFVERREDGAMIVTFASEDDRERVLAQGSLTFRNQSSPWKLLKSKNTDAAPTEPTPEPKARRVDKDALMIQQAIGISGFGRQS